MPSNNGNKTSGTNGWDSWGKHVLEELKRINDKMDSLDRGFRSISIEVATLKVKSGVWGAVGASIPLLLAFIFWMLKG